MKRIFLVGNGPSLQNTPLELLAGVDTMAMNAIDLIYPQTTWRPTYYFCIDVNENDTHWRQAIRSNMDCKRLFLWEGFNITADNVEQIKRCKKHHFYAFDNAKGAKEWHLPDLCTAYGSMSPMMQLAVNMGYEEIYLVGCDGFSDGRNHFTEKYPHYCRWQGREEINNYLHDMAKRCSPVPIYNATVGGHLEIHPRVDIRKVLSG